jgi:hypothetical protein
MTSHRLRELESIELHRLIAANLTPDTVRSARSRMATWAREPGRLRPGYAQAWLTLLDAPTGVLRDALVEDSELMRTLRSCTPFAGVLNDEQRLEARRSVAAR